MTKCKDSYEQFADSLIGHVYQLFAAAGPPWEARWLVYKWEYQPHSWDIADRQQIRVLLYNIKTGERDSASLAWGGFNAENKVT